MQTHSVKTDPFPGFWANEKLRVYRGLGNFFLEEGKLEMLIEEMIRRYKQICKTNYIKCIIDQRHINARGVSFCKNPPVDKMLNTEKSKMEYCNIQMQSIDETVCHR